MKGDQVVNEIYWDEWIHRTCGVVRVFGVFRDEFGGTAWEPDFDFCPRPLVAAGVRSNGPCWLVQTG